MYAETYSAKHSDKERHVGKNDKVWSNLCSKLDLLRYTMHLHETTFTTSQCSLICDLTAGACNLANWRSTYSSRKMLCTSSASFHSILLYAVKTCLFCWRNEGGWQHQKEHWVSRILKGVDCSMQRIHIWTIWSLPSHQRLQWLLQSFPTLHIAIPVSNVPQKSIWPVRHSCSPEVNHPI